MAACPALAVAVAMAATASGADSRPTCAFVTGGSGVYALGADCVLCRLRALGSPHGRVLAVWPRNDHEDPMSSFSRDAFTCLDDRVDMVSWPWIPNPYNYADRNVSAAERARILEHVADKARRRATWHNRLGVMTKLNIFRTLHNKYSRVVWIDPDAVVVKGVDALCELPGWVAFAATRDASDKPGRPINSGVFATRTMGDAEFRERVLLPLQRLELHSYNAGDQGAIWHFVQTNYDAAQEAGPGALAADLGPGPGGAGRGKYVVLQPKGEFNLWASNLSRYWHDRRLRGALLRTMRVLHYTSETKPWAHDWHPDRRFAAAACVAMVVCTNMHAFCANRSWCTAGAPVVRTMLAKHGAEALPDRFPWQPALPAPPVGNAAGSDARGKRRTKAVRTAALAMLTAGTLLAAGLRFAFRRTRRAGHAVVLDTPAL